jgi:hypothetical protein
MKFLWGWQRKRQGRDVPVTSVRVTHDIDIVETEMILADWVTHQDCWHETDVDDRRAGMGVPVLTAAMIVSICRSELALKGASSFESYWSDEWTTDEIGQVQSWARRTVQRCFPKQFEQTYGKGI